MRPRHYCRGRRASRSWRGSRRYCRFNEAAALLPREAASAPRSMALGTICFNEAAALLPREALPQLFLNDIGSRASMRPRHYCRGRPVTGSRCTRAACRASMRPRHYCRGRPAVGVVVLLNGLAASMRPRHYCRGRRGHGRPSCGYDGDASMRPRHYCRGRPGRLRPADRADHRFNEAAALLPREAFAVVAWVYAR